jgi:hypothetical protein
MGALQQMGADTPEFAGDPTMTSRIRSLITTLMSLLATVAAIVIALLPAMLAPAA